MSEQTNNGWKESKERVYFQLEKLEETLRKRDKDLNHIVDKIYNKINDMSQNIENLEIKVEVNEVERKRQNKKESAKWAVIVSFSVTVLGGFLVWIITNQLL